MARIKFPVNRMQLLLLLLACLSVLPTLRAIWLHVTIVASRSLYTSVDALPSRNVGVLLGTSKYLRDGRLNLFLEYRIRAAVDLYQAGRIRHILVSGDNAHRSYNEPETIRDELLKRGIPADRIHLDYAGFRTLDSMVRAKAVFGQDSFTVISQQFHVERAVFIARRLGIDAIGYTARDVDRWNGMRTKLREILARMAAMLDVYVLGTEPKFYGPPVPIPGE